MPPVNEAALRDAIEDLAAVVRAGIELTEALLASVADDYGIAAELLERKFRERYPHGVGTELPVAPIPREAPLKPSKLVLAIKRALLDQGENVDDERLANITLKLRNDGRLRRRMKRDLHVQAKLAEIEPEIAERRLARLQRL